MLPFLYHVAIWRTLLLFLSIGAISATPLPTLGQSSGETKTKKKKGNTTGKKQDAAEKQIAALEKEAAVLNEKGQYAASAAKLEKALEIAEPKFGKDSLKVADLLIDIGNRNLSLQQLDRAESLYRRCLEIRRAKLGENHVQVARCLNNLGLVAYHRARWAEAAPLFRQALEICDKSPGENQVFLGMCLNNLGNVLYNRREYVKAAPIYERSLAIREAVHGKSHVEVAATLYNLGNVHYSLGDIARAETLYERSLRIREAALGKDHGDVANCQLCLGNVLYAKGDYARAQEHYEHCLAIRESLLGKEHVEVAKARNSLADVYIVLGDYARAEALCRRSLEIFEAKLGKDDPAVATNLNRLGDVNFAMGRYAKAEALARRALEIRESKLGKDHVDVAASLFTLGDVCRATGRYAKAEEFYQRCLMIREKQQGTTHFNVSNVLNNLALLYRAMGQYAKAEAHYKRCLEINEARGDKDHPNVATALNNLGGVYRVMGRYAEAEPLLRRALEIWETKLGKDHRNVAATLASLGLLYKSMGEPGRAEPFFRRALEIREVKLGRDHPEVGLTLKGLGVLLRERGELAEAENCLSRALEISRARFGKDHAETGTALAEIGRLNAHKRRPAEAVRNMDRGLRILRKHTVTVLPILGDSEQQEFLAESFTEHFHAALSLGLAFPLDEENRQRAASWLLNGKAIAQEAMAERALLARDNEGGDASNALAELEDVRRELANLTLQDAQGGKGEQKARIEELREKEKRLAASLTSFDYRTNRDDPWFDLDDLRQRLPAGSVYVDFARFPASSFKAHEKDEQPARYAAFVTTKEGAVHVVDIGPAERIESAIQKVQQGIKKSYTSIGDQGEVAAEKALAAPLSELSKLLLMPLRKHLDDAERWILSPDGALWLCPWSALPLDDGKGYAVERHTIQFVVSGRDLLLQPLKLDRKPSAPVVLADPDYNLGREEAANLAETVNKRRGEEEATRSPSAGLRLGDIKRLPYTAAEAEAITPKLAAWAGAAPSVFTGKQALETVVRKVKGPRALVLSTHGFFLEDQKKTGDDKAPIRKAIDNPLLRCGLLLAGCNNPPKNSGAGDDGVLTGLEVVSIDLRGTDLVVLSACETGLGKVRNGEGVAGLRQAFQLAGAEAVVATLWQIPDRQSAQLMVRFFDELAVKKDKATALAAAQRQMIKERRSRNSAAHPFFWAAFTMTGR